MGQQQYVYVSIGVLFKAQTKLATNLEFLGVFLVFLGLLGVSRLMWLNGSSFEKYSGMASVSDPPCNNKTPCLCGGGGGKQYSCIIMSISLCPALYLYSTEQVSDVTWSCLHHRVSGVLRLPEPCS